MKTFENKIKEYLDKRKEKKFKEWQEKFKEKPPIDGPQVDDWVICTSQAHKLDPNNHQENELEMYIDFMSNNMGKIVSSKKLGVWNFDIYFENFPEELSGWLNPVLFAKDYIDFHSPNKEDIEAILQANKYNM